MLRILSTVKKLRSEPFQNFNFSNHHLLFTLNPIGLFYRHKKKAYRAHSELTGLLEAGDSSFNPLLLRGLVRFRLFPSDGIRTERGWDIIGSGRSNFPSPLSLLVSLIFLAGGEERRVEGGRGVERRVKAGEREGREGVVMLLWVISSSSHCGERRGRDEVGRERFVCGDKMGMEGVCREGGYGDVRFEVDSS